MLRILFDHDFNHQVIAALRHRLPELDFVTAFEAGIHSVHDRVLLRWAMANERVVISHDRKTMPVHFADLLGSGEKTSGLIIVPQSIRFHQAVEELEYFVVCTEHGEWIDRIHVLSSRR